MAVKFSNFAESVLLQSAEAADTIIYIDSDDASLFPTLGGGDTFRAVIFDNTYREIVICTAISSNALTVTRAAESTTARAWPAGSAIRQTATAAQFEQVLNAVANAVFEGAVTGTNAYTVTQGASSVIPSLSRGERVTALIPNTNTGAATLNVTNGVTSTGAQAIRDVNGDVLEPGDLKSGFLAVLQWDEDNTYWRLVSSASRQVYATSINSGPIGGSRNIVPNSQVRDWNLGTSFSTPASLTETADGWFVEYDGAIGTFTVARQAFLPGQVLVPGSPNFFFRWDQSSAGSGSTFRRVRIPLRRRVEWRNGEKIALSFYAKADSNRNVTAKAVQNFGTGGSPSANVDGLSGVLELTTSWQQFTLTGTLPSTSGKTLGSANNDALILTLDLPVNVTLTIDFANMQVESGDVVSLIEPTAISDSGIGASQILNLLKTVDGAGSGLDADTLDGYNIGTSGGTIPLLNGANTWAGVQTYQNHALWSADNTFDIGASGATRPRTGYFGTSVVVNGNAVFHTENDGSGSGLDADTLRATTPTAFGLSLLDDANQAAGQTTLGYTAADVLAKLLTVDGAGTGLDADTVDGFQAASFARMAATNTFSIQQIFSQAAAAATNTTRVINTTDNAAVAVASYEGDRATPAAFDTAYNEYKLSDSAGNQDTAYQLTWGWTVATSGSETGYARFSLRQSGTVTGRLDLYNTGLIPVQNNQLALGSASLSFAGLWLASAQVINFGNSNVIITHATGVLTISGGDFVLADVGPTSVRSAGFRGMPQSAGFGVADYTALLTDAGKHFYHTSATPHTFTIPANASVAFPIGTTFTIINGTGAGNVTVAITTDTLRRGDGTAGTGSRTLAANNQVTLVKTNTTEWFIFGTFT